MILVYKDEEGDDNTVEAFGYDTDETRITVHGVQGNVRITHEVVFSQCDITQSASCELTFQTSTK